MSSARRILLVDDDEDLRESLKDQLALHDEFEIVTAGTASSGIDIAKGDHLDLVLLDVGLPDMDGREACKVMRKNGFKSPIVMLTGNAADADVILGLDAGANDYITKPFKFAVLLARIRAQLRQHEQSEDAVFAIGQYTFKPASKMLIDEKGSKVRLTEKETSILKYLYRAGEKVVTRDVLLHEVWGYNAGVTTHTLETHIYRLQAEDREGSVERRAAGDGDGRLQAGAVEQFSIEPKHCSTPSPVASKTRLRLTGEVKLRLWSEKCAGSRLLCAAALRCHAPPAFPSLVGFAWNAKTLVAGRDLGGGGPAQVVVGRKQ